MKNPVHPGKILANALSVLHLGVYDGAELLGLEYEELNSILLGDKPITDALANILEVKIGSTARAWLEMQKNYDEKSNTKDSSS